MLSAPPRLAPWIAGAALGALGGSALRLTTITVGAGPGALLIAAAAVALGVGIGLAMPGGRRDPVGLLPLLAAPTLLALGDPALRTLGAITELLAMSPTTPGWVAAALLAALCVPVGRRTSGASAIGGAIGLVLGWALPGGIGAAIAAIGLALAPTAPSRRGAEPARAALIRSLGVAAASLAGGWLFLSTRVSLDPSPQGALALALGGAIGLGAGARLRRDGVEGAAMLGAAGLAVAWAALAAATPSLDALSAALFEMARAEGGPGVLALSLPALGLGLAAGLLIGALASGAALGLGLAVGLPAALLVADADGWTPLVLAGALGASAVLWGERRTQLKGVGLVAAALALAFLGPAPDRGALSAGRFANQREPGARDRDARSRSANPAAWQGFDGAVPGEVRAPPPTWNKRNAREEGAASERVGADRVSPDQPPEPLLIEIDGLVAEARSRAAGAEALAGQLARLLAADTGRALLLGDETGRALQGLGAFGQVTVATPVVAALRAAAGLDPAAELRWLSGGVRLLPVHPELALRTRAGQDAIVEISRAPWGDGARPALSGPHLAAAARRLNPGGLYVLVLHLGWWSDGDPAAAVGALAERFGAVQLWLPPDGADSAILVASDAPIPLDRLIERLGGEPSAPLPEPLRALGLRSALDLASLAVLGDGAVRSWAETGRADPLGLRPLGLSAAILSRPVLHLAGLRERISAPGEIWRAPLPEGLEAPLQARLSARGAFLAVVGDAARGDMEAVFNAARSLRLIEGEVGRSALDPLLEPHLERGRESLRRAEAEGVGSKAWDEASAAAVTAQVLNPDSPAPLVLLGDIALGQGNTRQAEESYQGAVDRDRDDVAAWTGLARVHRVRKDLPRAEAALREAARAGARQWSTWQNLGVFLLEQGRTAEAEDALRRSASLAASLPAPAPGERSPARAAPQLALAELYLETGAPTRALIELERAIQEGAGGYAWYLRGRAHFDLAQLDLAEEDFRAAVLADPELIEARGAIGHLRALARDWAAAAESFRAVLARDPDNAPARENLRQVLQEQAAEEERRRKDRGAPQRPAAQGAATPAPSAPQPQLGVQGP